MKLHLFSDEVLDGGAPGHNEERVEGCRQDGTEDEVDVEPGDPLGRDDRGEDAARCDEVGQVHQQDGHRTLPFFFDQLQIVLSIGYPVEQDYCDSGADRADNTMDKGDREAGQD